MTSDSTPVGEGAKLSLRARNDGRTTGAFNLCVHALASGRALCSPLRELFGFDLQLLGYRRQSYERAIRTRANRAVVSAAFGRAL